MKVLFTTKGWEDYTHWQSNDGDVTVRINRLISEICRNPFTGIGKPEPLRQNWAGWWSRRITGEHRIIYRVTGKEDERRLEIAQCRFHY